MNGVAEAAPSTGDVRRRAPLSRGSYLPDPSSRRPLESVMTLDFSRNEEFAEIREGVRRLRRVPRRVLAQA